MKTQKRKSRNKGIRSENGSPNTVASSKWDDVFNLCVRGLEKSAQALDPYFPGGMDYVKINVIAFCIVAPVLFGTSVATNIYLLAKLKAANTTKI